MSDRKLLQRLQKAYQCCDACGTAYGTPTGGYSTYWRGVCDVCGLELAVTETRDWGYLQRGISSARSYSRLRLLQSVNRGLTGPLFLCHSMGVQPTGRRLSP